MMTTSETVSFILKVGVIFISPFFLLKVFTSLKTKIEPQVSTPAWSIDDQNSFRLQKDWIRGYAQFFIFLGVLLSVFVLLNDLGDAQSFYIAGALMLIIGAFGVWKRIRWAVWVTLFPLLAFGIYGVWLNWKNLFLVWILFLFVKIAFQIDKNIQQVRSVESDR
jgi:hypothetical protein